MKNLILKVNNKQYNFEFIQKIRIESLRTFSEEEISRHINKRKLVASLQDVRCDIKSIKEIEFCRFKLDKDITDSGVYIWQINSKTKYIGSAKNLKERFNNGYGIISPRNIFYGGQSTNCKMNRVVVNNQNKEIKIYFYKTKNYEESKKVEKEMLQSYKNNEQDIAWEELYNVKSL